MSRALSQRPTLQRPAESVAASASANDARKAAARYLYAAKLPAWTTALAAVKAGTRDAKVLIVGDSTSAGVGGNTDATFTHASSWGSFMCAELDRTKVAAAHGLGVPRGESSGALADSRWTFGAGWTRAVGAYQNTYGFAGKGTAYTASDGTTYLTYKDPRVTADTYDIYYLGQTTGGLGTLEATVTGASPVTVATGTGASKAVRKLTITAPAANATNIVSIRNIGNPIFVIAVEPSLSTTRKVRVGNGSAAGASSITWTTFPNADTTQRFNGIGAIEAYQPDLTIIDLGINDAQGILGSTAFMTNITALVTAAKITGDVIIKTMIPSQDPTTFSYEQAYVVALLATAYPAVDMFNRYGTYAQSAAAGLVAGDGLHGNVTMYQDEGYYIAAALSI